MIGKIAIMAVWLHFSSWWFADNIAALFGFCKTGRRLLVTDGLHIDGAKFFAVIDRLPVFVYRLALHSGLTMDGVPLATFGMWYDTTDPAMRRIR